MINIRFLGTGALGSVRPRNKLSKEYRRFPTLLIDERIIIDPSEDIFELEESFMLSGLYKDVREVLITHSHLDHFSISAIEKLASRSEICVYATEDICRALSGLRGVSLRVIHPFARFFVGKFEVIALPANHITENPTEVPLNFLVRAEKTLFYGLDGSFINPSAFEILKEVKLDLCILDCALGTSPAAPALVYHNNLDMARLTKDVLISARCADDSTKFVISHIPTLKKRNLHEELTEAIGDEPIRIAYDGYYIGI